MRKEYEEIASIGNYLCTHSYSTGTAGNISVRLSDGSIIITATNTNLGMLGKKDFAILSADGKHVGGNKPSKEYTFHHAIYTKLSDCNAIIHLHSTYLTALSCLKHINPKSVLDPLTPYAIMRVGDVALVPYFKPGSPQIGEYITTLPNTYTAFLLANHGIIVAAHSLSTACNNFEELEVSARNMLILQGAEVSLLSQDEVQALKDK